MSRVGNQKWVAANVFIGSRMLTGVVGSVSECRHLLQIGDAIGRPGLLRVVHGGVLVEVPRARLGPLVHETLADVKVSSPGRVVQRGTSARCAVQGRSGWGEKKAKTAGRMGHTFFF